MKKEDLKALVFALLLVLFESIVYFLCKFSPISVNILTSEFDAKLPLIPFFACFYYLWYIYLFLIPFILNRIDKKQFFKYASITVICILIGALIFIFFPTTFDRGVDLNNYKSIFTYLVKFIYFTDTPNLCCLPSMRCALSFIFIYISLKTKDLKWYYKLLITITSLGIVASTLLIKQHVIWDVFAAILVVIISILIDKYTNIGNIIENKLKFVEKLIEKIFVKTKLDNKLK